MSHPDPLSGCLDCGAPCEAIDPESPQLCAPCLDTYRAVERERELSESRESEPAGATE